MNRYEEYQETGFEWLGKIPSNWGLSRVGKFFTERSEKVDDVTYPPLSVTMSGIVDQLSDVAKTNDGGNRKLVKKHDFVINSRSDRKGSSGISPRDGSVSLINIVLEPRELDPQFIQYLFKNYYFKEEYFRNGKGIHWDLWTTRWDQLKNIKFPIPSNKEQKLISRYLDKKTEQIDSLIEKIQKKIELLKEQRTSLINQCVTKGLDPSVEMKDSGVEWIDEIPKHWRQQSIKHVLNDYFGGSWGEDLVEGQTKGVVQVVRVTEFDWNTLSVSEKIPTLRSLELKEDSKKLVRRGDLVIEKSGGGEKTPVGRVILIDRELTRPTVNSNFTNIFRPNQEKLDPGFGVYLFYISYVGGMTVRNIKQTTGIQNLDIEGFLSEKIFLPPKEEQEQIQIFLDNSIKKILHLVRKHTDQLKLLTEYRQSLISSVVTGKVCVTEDMI